MAYNNMINRSGATVLIPEEVSREIVQAVPGQSIFLRRAQAMPPMTRKQLKIPVMTGNVEAFFVAGDTGLKQTTAMTWDGVYITAEEIAAIVPIPEAVLDDADYDIWAEVRPRLIEAFARVIDKAAFFGVNKPQSWPDGIVPAAIDAGNAVALGTGTNLYQDINGVDGVVAKVEEQGIDATGYVGAVPLRARLRGAVDSNGQPIFRTAYANGAAGSMTYELNGVGIDFANNGAWDAEQALLLAGDFSFARYAIRQDISYKLLDQASITDADGKVVLNLAQQDAVALRAVMRLGWALPKPVNPMSGVSYYPFSVLTPASDATGDEGDEGDGNPLPSA